MTNRSLIGIAALATAGLFAMPASSITLSPTGIPATDTQAIKDAVAASGNGVVYLNAGSFKILKAIEISNGASLVGLGGSRRAELSLATQTQEDGSEHIIKITGSANTVISNLTVTARDAKYGNTAYGPATAIKMDSGALVDCLVTEVRTKNGGQYGGGVNLSGSGLVRGCTISHCEADNSGGSFGPGEAIYMNGGTVENCIITQNIVSYTCGTGDGSAYGGTVSVLGGVLRGCLIYENVAHTGASGVLVEGSGTVENCTIACNRQLNAGSNASGLRVRSSSAIVRNNIIWDNKAFDGSDYNISYKDPTYETRATLEGNDSLPAIAGGSSNISADPRFVDAANGDYHTRYSYAIDAGIAQSWMSGAYDLDGHVRVINGRVDMGCYERAVPAGLEGRISLESDGAMDRSRVSLMCDTIGGEATSVNWRFTNQLTGYVVNHSGDQPIDLTPGVWNLRVVFSDGARTDVVESEAAVDVRASRVYASEKGGNEFPYDTLAKAARSIDDAFPLVGIGGTLLIDKGSYVINNPLVIEEKKGSRIESLYGPDQTIIRLADCNNFKKGGYYGLTLSRSDAYVSGVTIIGGRIGPDYEGPEYTTLGLLKVKAEGAVVTNCVFRDLKTSTASSGDGNAVALSLSDGLVVDCLFTRVDHYTAGGAIQYGGVIYIEGGVADRLRVEDCWDIANAIPGAGGDIVAVLKTGVLRNSIVTRCTSQHEVPVYVGVPAGSSPSATPSGSIINCTVVANTNLQMKATDDKGVAYKHEAGVYVNGGALINSIVVGNWSSYGDYGVGKISNLHVSSETITVPTYTLVDDRAGDADFLAPERHNINVASYPGIFRKPAKGDYSLAARSPAVNVGLLQDWMATALDLEGHARVISKIPDLGCFEARAPGFAIRLK